MDDLKSVAMVCRIGDVMCDTLEDRNAWKKKMLSTVHGISFPSDFDTLPEEEKQRRLDKVIEEASPLLNKADG